MLQYRGIYCGFIHLLSHLFTTVRVSPSVVDTIIDQVMLSAASIVFRLTFVDLGRPPVVQWPVKVSCYISRLHSYFLEVVLFFISTGFCLFLNGDNFIHWREKNCSNFKLCKQPASYLEQCLSTYLIHTVRITDYVQTVQLLFALPLNSIFITNQLHASTLQGRQYK